jgi:large subunit ribosomal protein L10
MDRAEKQQELQELQSTFADNEIVIVSHNKGMSVAQVTKLRKTLRANGARYKVTKNTLARLAAKGTKFEDLTGMLVGPTGLTTSKDPVAAAKTIHEFAKTSDEKLVILGGLFGAMKLDAKGIEKLAKLPSLNELRAKILGLLQAPATKVAGVVQAPAGQLARLIAAKSRKDS